MFVVCYLSFRKNIANAVVIDLQTQTLKIPLRYWTSLYCQCTHWNHFPYDFLCQIARTILLSNPKKRENKIKCKTNKLPIKARIIPRKSFKCSSKPMLQLFVIDWESKATQILLLLASFFGSMIRSCFTVVLANNQPPIIVKVLIEYWLKLYWTRSLYIYNCNPLWDHNLNHCDIS